MAKKEAPCEAVMLLMNRMETHPDEFRLEKNSRWGHLMSIVKTRVVDKDPNAFIVLEDYECDMLWNKFKAAGKKQLHAYVMDKILNPEGEKRE
jgi:hypothetical protein